GQVLLARDFLLRRRLDRQARQAEAVGARMKEHVDRIPGDRRPDLPGIELDVVDAELLERDRELQADRAGADDGNLAGLHASRVYTERPMPRRRSRLRTVAPSF